MSADTNYRKAALQRPQLPPDLNARLATHGHDKLTIALACFPFQWQGGFEAPSREIFVRDVCTVWLQLRQKPAFSAIVETHGASPFLPPHRSLIFGQTQGTLSIARGHAVG